jgi:hypothetical protein
MKNLAPAGGATEGAAGLLYDGMAPDAPPLLNVSTYLKMKTEGSSILQLTFSKTIERKK